MRRATEAGGTHPARHRRRPAGAASKALAAAAAVLAAVVTVPVAFAAVARATGNREAGTAQLAAAQPRPRLGPIRTVDSNDVGDPFVLTVPAGISPPGGLPFQVPGPDSYTSAPWTPATATAARTHGWYVLFGTTDWQENVPTAVSTDLVHWTQAPDALPVLPAWAAATFSMTWAPAARRHGADWVLYYSTEERRSHRECIGRAVSPSPAGPFTDSFGGPLVCQRRIGGSIDPSVVADPAGTDYLVWKNDGNAIGSRPRIWIAPLSRDGTGLAGPARPLFSAGQPWDAGVVEAPSMVAGPDGGYWLFYSAGHWDSDRYGTGLAWCRTVTGPCADTSSRPYLATTAAVISPGGLDSFRALDGRLWVGFTALVATPSEWDPGRTYFNRVLDIAPVLSGVAARRGAATAAERR